MSNEAVVYLVIGFVHAAVFAVIGGFWFEKTAPALEQRPAPIAVACVSLVLVLGWPLIFVVAPIVGLWRIGEWLARKAKS